MEGRPWLLLEAQTTVIEKIELRPERPIVFEILSDNFEFRNWQKCQRVPCDVNMAITLLFGEYETGPLPLTSK